MTKTRFEDKYKINPVTGCWDWIGAKDSRGRYGNARDEGKIKRSHRVSYEKHKGKIPEGLQIDHLCRNTLCCNPDHLEAVTSRENTLRGEGIQAKNARKTHCKHGHEFDNKNTYYHPVRGGRLCRKCNLIAVKKYKNKWVTP